MLIKVNAVNHKKGTRLIHDKENVFQVAVRLTMFIIHGLQYI